MACALLFLAAFLSLANAEAPRTPVYSALAPESQSVVPLADLIKGFDATAQLRALEALDKLDRAPLGAKDLGELSEAYRLLGRRDRAIETASIISTRGGGAGGSMLQVQALANSGDFKGARAAAEAALTKYPNDQNLLAAYHNVKNRSENGNSAEARATTPKTSVQSSSTESRPYVLSVAWPKKNSGNSSVETLSLSGADESEEPTLWDKISGYLPAGKIVDEDIALLREKARDFEIREDMTTLATTKPEVPRQFVAWLKTMKPEDLPPIRYGVVEPGDLAEYQKGLGKGKIVMSYSLRRAEPEVRATALMHEVFHYWDIKVAGNPYATESYGRTDPSNLADREYDPYLLTALFWKHVRPNGVTSYAARSLDRLPTESEEMRQRVDALYERKRSQKR